MDTLKNTKIPNSETQLNKRRRKKSIVWEHFTVETVSPGYTRAYCRQCKKSFAYITGSKLAGTSHLKRHISLGICSVIRQKNQMIPYTPPSQNGENETDPPRRRYKTSGFQSTTFDKECCSHAITKMIIQHEYPLHIVEHPGFISFARALQPQFNVASLETIQGDCLALYLKQKECLTNFLKGVLGRVCISVDLWTCNQTLGYVFLTGHFIDGDWKLHRRVLNVVTVSSIESDEALGHAVAVCLSDWSLASRLFTLTFDQFLTNGSKTGNLRGLLSIKNPLMLNGQLLIGNCYARVLSRLAQTALASMSGTVGKVREIVKCVKTIKGCEEKFMDLKQQLQISSSKFLSIDNQMKWNTTYHMLVAFWELKEVFSCLDLDASDLDSDQMPSMDEWKQIECLLTYLKLFLDATSVLTGPAYPTANIFFHEVWKIQLELTHAAMSPDPFTSYLTKPLQEQFEKYWTDCCLVLATAVVMDPRFKMKLVEFSFCKAFGEDAETWVKNVDDSLHALFLEYITPCLTLPVSYVGEGNEDTTTAEHEEPLISADDGLSDFDVYISEITSCQQTKSELDRYLEESLLPRMQDFDILAWWNLNRVTYPTLSKMAKDILSIPFSTLPPESAFDTVGKKKVDSYRSSLPPLTLEALVCAKDWLQFSSSSSGGEPQLVEKDPPLLGPLVPSHSNAIVKVEFEG